MIFDKSSIHTNMITRLLFPAPLLSATFAQCGYADTVGGHRAAPMASPYQVPEDLVKSDWQSIRATYEAGAII